MREYGNVPEMITHCEICNNEIVFYDIMNVPHVCDECRNAIIMLKEFIKIHTREQNEMLDKIRREIQEAINDD